MVTRFALLILCLSACQAQQTGIVTVGSFAGTLKGDDGTLLAGGSVFLKRMSPGKVRRTEWYATSDAQGTFRFDALPTGEYTLCAQVPSGTWINPCEWGLNPPVVSVGRGSGLSSVTMVLKKGAKVPVRVDDAGQWLSQHEGKTPGAHLLLGVGNDAHVFYPASVSSQDTAGRNYQIVIPFDTPAKLVVHSSFFRLSDSGGRALAQAASTVIAITTPAGSNPSLVRLVVTGGGR